MANLKIKDENGNWVGIASIQGEPGPQGPAGAPGVNGKDGVTPTFEVGTVSTGEPNVEMTGENNHYTLDFTFPESSGGATFFEFTLGYEQKKPIVLEDLEPGLYVFNSCVDNYYMKLKSDYKTTRSFYPTDGTVKIFKRATEVGTGEVFGLFLDNQMRYNYIKKLDTDDSGGVALTYYNNNSTPNFPSKYGYQIISGNWTFSKLPESSQTPTKDTQFTTKAYVDNLINVIYPVGTYYETSDTSFNPNTSWGGTWVLEEDGTVLVSKSNVTDSKFNTDVGTVLGEEAVQLDLPNYQYNVWNAHTTNPGNDVSRLWSPDGDALGLGLVYESNKNVPHNNIQPSKIVNRWHRTA